MNMAEQKRVKRSYFDVLGLCCSSEVPLVENVLKPLAGVKEVTVIIATRTVVVLHDTALISQYEIVKALNEARLEANIRMDGEENFKRKWPSPYSVACGVLLLMSFLKYAYRPLGWLALGAVAIGVFPICLKAVASIRNLRLDINILAIVAVIGTIALGDYVEAGTIVFLFTIAEWLESRASYKANAVMTSLMSMVPQKAVIAETGEVVDADEVKLNTVLAVKAGEVIPIDGLIIEGNCEVDEKTLTGESFPVTKHKDSTVWAGTINLNGYISVKTTALAEDCAVAKMVVLVEEAQNSKSKTQRLIDRCAKFYTPAVIIVSILVAVIPVVLRLGNLNKWFHLALVILVSACPCALILSTPVAAFCALTKAAKSGLLVKGSDYLEALSKIKILAFDKTGTITKGEFAVSDFQPLHDDVSLEALLYWVSSIESKSSHPMAAALVDYGKSALIKPKPENVEDFQNFPGEGIYGRIDGNDVYIGNKKISARASCETIPTLEGYSMDGKSIGYVYCGGNPVGIFTISDACRSGVAEAIKELKLLGIKTAMLTGDSQAAAMYTHQQVGQAIEVIYAELLPEDKAKLIAEFKREGPTAMVGDGINDAPALATADVGISMGISGSALATETGHMILMSNDMRNIPKAIKLSRRATRKVMQNIILSIGTKVAILTLAIAGHPLVWAAVLADVGTCLLVILNSMLLLHESHSHGGKCCTSMSSSHVLKNGFDELLPRKSHRCCPKNKSLDACEPRSSVEARSLSHCCGGKCHGSADLNGVSETTKEPCEAQQCHRRQGCTEGASDNHHGLKKCSHSISSSAENRTLSCCGENHESSLKMAEPSSVRKHLKTHSCLEKNHEDCTTIDVAQVDENHAGAVTITHSCTASVKKGSERCCGSHTEPRELTVVDACMSLEKREVGGCCKSYMKECCSTKHGHLGNGLKCLSEVIIEN